MSAVEKSLSRPGDSPRESADGLVARLGTTSRPSSQGHFLDPEQFLPARVAPQSPAQVDERDAPSFPPPRGADLVAARTLEVHGRMAMAQTQR